MPQGQALALCLAGYTRIRGGYMDGMGFFMLMIAAGVVEPLRMKLQAIDWYQRHPACTAH